MAGFRKAKAEQAAVKMGIFGPAGSGKTFTSLLFAEGLARAEGKKVAFVDTEHGTDFYSMRVPTRRVHPEAFDFEAVYTRALSEVNPAVFALDPAEYGVVVIDSISHLWETAVNSYTGKKEGGKIPFHAWTNIKRAYKALMAWTINTPMHTFILGRQANEWGVNDDTGESLATGVKMKAEGETAYEPHILTRMEGIKPFRSDGKTVSKNAIAIPTMFVLKDRTGVLHGQMIEEPDFDKVIAPILPLLGKVQARQQTDDEAALNDAEANRVADQEKLARSDELRRQYLARIELVRGKPEQLELVAKELTPEVKKLLIPGHLAAVRQAYLDAKLGQRQAPREQPVDVDVPE